MMKKHVYKLFISILCILLFIITCKVMGGENTMNNNINKYDTYWQKVQKHEDKGLPKSALDVVDEIYKEAKKDNDEGQLIKAVIYKMKFLPQIVDENYQIKMIKILTDEIAIAKQPVTSLLHSILAECYWLYYNTNRHRFSDRSQTVDFDNDDIATWDLQKLIDEVLKNYLLSLENQKPLKKLPIEHYNVILERGNLQSLRPTLYDFLAHRAFDFFVNEEAYVTQPAFKFELDDEDIFKTAAQFTKKKFETTDTASTKYNALLIIQDLIDFHLKDKKPEALVDVDLKRLHFARSHAVGMDKDRLYMDALQTLSTRYKNKTASGVVDYHIAQYYKDTGDYVTAYQICERVLTKYPDTEGAINCKALKSEILFKELNFTTEKVNPVDKPSKILVTYRNVDTVYFKIIKLSNKQKEKADQIAYNQGTEAIIKYYSKLTPVESLQTTLPGTEDYKSHSVEVMIPALPSGLYVILASPTDTFALNENVVDYARTWVSNISFFQTPYRGKNLYYVFDRERGLPLKGVKADVYTQEYNYTTRRYDKVKSGSYTTDKAGYFEGVSKDNKSYYVDFTYKDDRLYLDDTFYPGYYYEQYPAGYQTFIFTDRSIYRPGQTIYYKGLIFNNTDKFNTIKKPVTGYATTIEFLDVNYQVIATHDVKTNEYGTFSGSFTAPTDRLNGQMTLRESSGSTNISVEEYKRPKFEVAFHPMEKSYNLEDMVEAKGFAKAYAGSNIDNAQVKYRVVRQAIFPYWYWWWGAYPSSPEMEITNGSTTTDEQGQFSINFKAIPDYSIDEDQNPVFYYTVYADVTDMNGETRSSQTVVTLGYIGLTVNLNLGDKINKNTNPSFTIETNNLNGYFEPAKGRIVIHQLQEPRKIFRERLWGTPDQFIYSKEQFYELFPRDAYGDEHKIYNFEKQKKAFETTFDTGKSKTFSIKNISTLPPGPYMLELTTKDNKQKPVKLIKHFTLYDDQAKRLPYNQTVWYDPVKTNVEPGEQALMDVGTSYKDTHSIYQVFHRDTIIKTGTLSLNDTIGRITIPIKEEYRGGLMLHVTFVKHNRFYNYSRRIDVPWTNKALKIEFETFRDKLLPGEQEEWKIKISGLKTDMVAAEMVASLFDASLEVFRPHYWPSGFYPYFSGGLSWNGYNSFSSVSAYNWNYNWNDTYSRYYKYYDRLNLFGLSFYYYDYYGGNEKKRSIKMMVYRDEMEMAEEPMEEMEMDMDDAKMEMKEDDLMPTSPSVDEKSTEKTKTKNGKDTSAGPDKPEDDMGDVKVRTNLNETAFFYPHLKTDKEGRVIVSFTIPEALTRWKLMGFAHTKDMAYGLVSKELVTQKDLMVMINAPRFFREHDTITFSAKVSNLSDSDLKGTAVLQLYDALTMEPIDSKLGNTKAKLSFTAKKGQSAPLSWKLTIPENVHAVTYRVLAKAGDYSDGEESTLPVLTNRMLVTESLPLPIRGKTTKNYQFKKLVESGKSDTLTHHRLTLEFSSNPAWYAIQALPYMMEYPHECSEQVFSRYYANSIAAHIANSSPRIKQVFDSWKDTESLLSNLEKNEELKSLLLQETPWVLQAQDESARKRRVGLLFDLTRMSNELEGALKKILQYQLPNGGWSWFPGLPDNRYITQHIMCGFGHLDRLGVTNDAEKIKIQSMINRGLSYLDDRMNEDYQYLLKHKYNLNQNNLNYTIVHYLYTRSFYSEVPVSHKKAFKYWTKQAAKYWPEFNTYMQGMIALGLNRFGDGETGADIVKSLKENALHSEEMGMYWKSNTGGYYWYQAPIETQSLLIEVFDEVANDQDSVEDAKVWLLKQKQTQDWKTTKATADACYALLLKGADVLLSEELVEITVGSKKIDPENLPDVKVEAGTGYFKTSWDGTEVTPDMGNVTLTKKDDGVAWGALYWQYFEQLDKITMHETPLKLQKQLFVERQTDRGPVIEPVKKGTDLQVGDLIKVRIELRVDRDMEYIHMKDMRASGFEPINVISTHKYQDGLWYYESTKDAATNFFIPWLNKGTYVFEYPLRVNHSGDFSNGITTIQCMYAPEYTAHSEGVRVKVQ